MMTDNSLGTGAYYEPDDYAGLSRRVGVCVIDSIVILVVGVTLWIALVLVYWTIDPTRDPSTVFYLLWGTLIWIYLVALKRSRFRTVGYRILGLMIVTTKGERPSLFTMTFRMLMWLFGPFNLVLDLIWLGADTEGQSLRDCYAGTYVVRNGARPIGSAPVHLTRYNAVGLTLAYPRVCRPSTGSPESG